MLTTVAFQNGRQAPIEGFCAPRFAAVREAFAENLAAGHEIGACFAMEINGTPVIDLWGGWRDANCTIAWEKDTIVCMMSVSKAMAALCVLLLADRGALDLDAPVARYWPAFAKNGKGGISVRTVLAQLAGLPYVDTLETGELWDTDKVGRALEAQAPEWPPGSTPCYHSLTAGMLYQKIVQHVDGRSLGQYFREEIAAPFNVDFRIGLKPAEDARRAEYIPTEGTPSWEGILGRRPSPLNRAWRSLERDEDGNSEHWRFGEHPSANGHGNARAAARIFGALAGDGLLNGKQLLSKEMIADASREQWNALEAMTGRPFRYGTGFMLSSPVFPCGGQPRCFGHMGIGGAAVFADPDRNLSMAYAGNHMAPVADAGPWATKLINAAYACLEG